MYVTGSSTIGELLGDFVAYRSLRPCDPRLAHFQVPSVPPRKVDPAYGHAVGDLLRHARRIDAPHVQLDRLIVIGDNAPTDGAAFEHLCAVNAWSGTALIVDERRENQASDAEAAPPSIPPLPEAHDNRLFLSHWPQLRTWAASAAATGIGASTVILLDIDKTLLGARGRNDALIDTARSVAMQAVIAELVGERFDAAVFDTARRTFNAREFHHLTGDNQDYVAYLSLLIAGGIWTTEALARAIQRGEITSIEALVASVEAVSGPAAEYFREIQADIVARIAAHDPTPFKAFRMREYQETIARMGIDAGLEIAERLHTEIVLTGEVLDVARRWQAQGALIFALSDKPDEAALPSPELQQRGYQPLHWVRTHIIDDRPLTTDHRSPTATLSEVRPLRCQ